MAETLVDLRKKLAEEEKELKKKYELKIKQVKEKERLAAAREAKKLRAQENHAKYLLAGYVIAEAKRTKTHELLNKCLASLFTDRDKADMNALIQSLK